MANQIGDESQAHNATGSDDREAHEPQDKRVRQPRSKGRDNTLEADLERERVEPGMGAGGTGGAGADPAAPHGGGNSNT
jgi:hypothetical protein